MRQITSDKQKVSSLQICHIIADNPISSTFSYQGEFDLRMEMPRRSIVLSLNLFTENSMLCTPWDLLTNRPAVHVIKVSELSTTK
jgi:hypothetical protein